MLIRNRVDGSLARVPTYIRVMPMLMPRRTDSSVFADSVLNIENTLCFIRSWNKASPEGTPKMSLMPVILCAIVQTLVELPAMNRFVSNFRYYQRNNISISFVVKKELKEDGKETNVTMPFKPDDNLQSVNKRYAAFLETAQSNNGNKSEKDLKIFEYLPIFFIRFVVWLFRFLDKHNWLPSYMIQMLPFYSSIFLTNLGSIGLDAIYHHNYELGNCGIFLCVGRVRRNDGTEIREPGIEQRKPRLLFRYTIDERIVDGIYSGKAMNRVKHYVENPELLVDRFVPTADQLRELKLSSKGWNLWNRNPDESFTFPSNS